MSIEQYDYVIVGAGAAGLQLALEINRESSLQDKSILILDRDPKNTNDRTWSYWENGEGKYDQIVSHQYTVCHFYGMGEELTLSLEPYRYKMIRSADFYAYAKKILSQNDAITWRRQEVKTIQEEGTSVKIKTSEESYLAQLVFDSRVDIDAFRADSSSTDLKQHFLGWIIEADKKAFNTDNFTMMDYRLKDPGTTSFMYILPFSETKALVEFTYFSPELVDQSVYEDYIQKYIRQHLKIQKWQILEKEIGTIPMSTHDFHAQSTQKIIKIGTAGSWVKSSSGYSFRNAMKYSERLVQDLKHGRHCHKSMHKKRFRLYDAVFLRVLKDHNELGEEIFTTLYKKQHIHHIFRFLDEESTVREEVGIMSSFKPWPFLRALFRL